MSLSTEALFTEVTVGICSVLGTCSIIAKVSAVAQRCQTIPRIRPVVYIYAHLDCLNLVQLCIPSIQVFKETQISIAPSVS